MKYLSSNLIDKKNLKPSDRKTFFNGCTKEVKDSCYKYAETYVPIWKNLTGAKAPLVKNESVQILGFYGLGKGTMIRTKEELLYAMPGKAITVSGTTKYDGNWVVTKAFAYKGKKDKQKLWGYQIQKPWTGFPKSFDRIKPENNKLMTISPHKN